MEKENIFFIIILILGVILIAYGIYLDVYNKTNFANVEECKVYYWEKCGLVYSENKSEMCWRTADNNNSRWDGCQLVSEKKRDCWKEKFDFCFNMTYETNP